MDSHQDLTSVGAEGDEANRVVGAETNASDMDDLENSYVFVNGSEGTTDDPGVNELDVDVPGASAETEVVEDFTVSGDLSKSFEEERHGSLQGIGVFLSTTEGEVSEDCLAGKENVDGTQVTSNGSVENQIEDVESQKYECSVESKPQTIDLKSSYVTSQDQVDLRSSSVDSGDANQVTQEIILDSVIDLVDLDSATEQNNIDLTVDQHNSDSDLTLDQHNSDSTVGVENADSITEQNKLGLTNNIDLTIITVEGQNNQHVVVDAAECDPDKTDLKKGNYVDQTLQPCDVLEEGEKCTMAPMDDFECKSQHAKPEVGEVNEQQKSEVMATEIVEDGESYTHVNIPVESNSCELDHEGENLEKESSKGFSSDANPELERVRVDQGHEMENVVNEKHTSLEAGGGAISLVLCDKQVSVLVSHATDHVSQLEEGSGQIDVGETSHEFSISSEEAKIMGAPAACMMSEGDTREKPIDTTYHVSQSKEGSGQIDVGESSHELSRSSEEAKIMGDPAACMMSEGDTREKLIDDTIGKVSEDCENRYGASPSTESISVQDAEVLEPRSCDEHVVSSVADGSCALVMNSLENDTSLGTEFGIQNSASEEVSALAGESSLHDSKSENLDLEAAVVESKFLGHDSISSCSPTDSSSKTTFSLLTDKSEQKVQGGTEISNEGAELAHGQCSSTVVQLSKVGNSSTSINRDMHGDDTLESGLESLKSSFDNNGSPPNHTKNLEVQCNGSERSSEDNLVCQEFVVADKSLCNETLDILLEGSSANVAGQDASTGTFGGLKKPFQFLIKMPRFDDEKLREQIRLAQLHVDEKTQSRDAIWQEIKKKRANCQHHGVEFEAAKSEERVARKLVRSKRAEIEHLQTAINRVKNALSVEEIDARICSMEHMIEHETLPLKEEKNLIREIKQLKQLRNQLSSNIGSCDEVQQALDNRDQIEESLKILKKELDSLKNKVSKAEAVAVAVSLRYEEESKMHKELRAQYKAANEIRQAAYGNLQNLKKILYEKNNHFRMYKDNASTASRHAAHKDTEALHHLCANQVEKYMELWNRDDEFRQEYVRCNMRSTVRRLGTLDGRPLGPNEDPPVLPVYVAERTDRVISRTSKVDFVSPTLPLQQEKQVMLIKDEDIARKPMVKGTGQKTERERKTSAVKSNLESADNVSSWDVSNDVKREDIQIQTKEELELARKEEEVKRLETAARLKEQRRLEEIAKAKEALERKKRNAEKAQVRSELRALKEAEQKEKEREKRLRKKEKKKGGGSEAANESENVSFCESIKDVVNEAETKETEEGGKKTQKAPQYAKQNTTKSIPPPLRNKNKKKMQQWMRIIFTSIIVIALFLLGNIGFFANLKSRQNVL
ncbi:PREDICTED: cingulin-like isoform X2 [Ipomoea nil]|uniref:cingulin-like isoform X2 n=1 Tax=Ipomoea nil TaxID=35883 RepID=UPI000900B4E2|nr:PREDICTED: cingulin-like isoform X2 [Ipomoea nil]